MKFKLKDSTRKVVENYAGLDAYSQMNSSLAVKGSRVNLNSLSRRIVCARGSVYLQMERVVDMERIDRVLAKFARS